MSHLSRRSLLRAGAASLALATIPRKAGATAVSVAMDQPFRQRAASGWTIVSAHVSGSGSFDWRITDVAGNLISTPGLNSWATATAPAAINIVAPAGGPYRIMVREHANPSNTALSPTGTLVGDLRAMPGDSIANYMLAVWPSPAPTPPTPDIHTMAMTHAGWLAPVGQGMTSFLNTLYSLTGIPQAVMSTALGGVSLTADGYMAFYERGTPINGSYLMSGASAGAYDPWQLFLNDVAATSGGGFCGVITDVDFADQDVDAETYARGRAELWSNVQAVAYATNGWKAPPLRCGWVKPYSPSADLSGLVRGHNLSIATMSGAYEAGDRSDLTYPDGYHPDGASYLTRGARLATNVAREEYGIP